VRNGVRRARVENCPNTSVHRSSLHVREKVKRAQGRARGFFEQLLVNLLNRVFAMDDVAKPRELANKHLLAGLHRCFVNSAALGHLLQAFGVTLEASLFFQVVTLRTTHFAVQSPASNQGSRTEGTAGRKPARRVHTLSEKVQRLQSSVSVSFYLLSAVVHVRQKVGEFLLVLRVNTGPGPPPLEHVEVIILRR